MKQLLVVSATSWVLFILSASACYIWLQKQEGVSKIDVADKEASDCIEVANLAAPPADANHDDSPPQPATCPASNPGAEEIARMTTELHTRLDSVRGCEEQLTARRKMIELIQDDIRGERTALDELRSQIKSELTALNEAVEGAEKPRGSLDEEHPKVSKNTQEMEAQIVQLQKEEQDNLKKMSGVYNSMSPEIAAKILQNLAGTGKMDTAVKLLGQMQESQAAKALAELTDAGLAAQLVEKLKSLRPDSANPDSSKP